MKRGCVVLSLIVGIGLIGIIGGIMLLQLVPYGKDQTNPSVIQEPAWDSPETRTLAQRACFDCHSNETVWPWYSKIAPVSWLVWKDVQEGREELNFSDWNGRGGSGEEDGEEFEEIEETIREGEMPPSQYLLMHPEAKLNQEEKGRLISGFNNSIQ